MRRSKALKAISVALLGVSLGGGQVACASKPSGQASPIGHWELADNAFRTPAVVWIEPYPGTDLLRFDAHVGCSNLHRAVRATNGRLEDAPEPVTNTVVEAIIEGPCYPQDRNSAAAQSCFHHAAVVLDAPATFEIVGGKLVLRNDEHDELVLRQSSGKQHPWALKLHQPVR